MFATTEALQTARVNPSTTAGAFVRLTGLQRTCRIFISFISNRFPLHPCISIHTTYALVSICWYHMFLFL